MRITRQGKGLWTYRYRLNKTSHEMSLWTYPKVILSEARDKLAEQKRLRLNQINPLHENVNFGIKASTVSQFLNTVVLLQTGQRELNL